MAKRLENFKMGYNGNEYIVTFESPFQIKRRGYSRKMKFMGIIKLVKIEKIINNGDELVPVQYNKNMNTHFQKKIRKIVQNILKHLNKKRI